MKRLLLLASALHLFIYTLLAQSPCDTLRLSLSDALCMAKQNNRAIDVAEQGVAMARQDMHLLRSAWWPTITLTGEALHTTTPIELNRSIGELSDGLLGEFEQLIEGNPMLEEIITSVADATVGIEFAPRNTASVGAEIVWPLFSGGKRIIASRVGRLGVELATTAQEGVQNKVLCATTEAYLAVEVAQMGVEVCRKALNSSLEVVREAKCLEHEGIINKAERLSAEVGAATMASELVGAQSRLSVARASLGAILGVDTLYIVPTTPLGKIEPLPSKEFFLLSLDNNTSIRSTQVEAQLAREQLHINQSRYLPEVAIIGSHRLWSSGIDAGLVPRTFVGVGATWTLFDGTAREQSIAKSRTLVRTAQLAEEQLRQQLTVEIEALYGQLAQAHQQLTAIDTTIALAEELARTRRRAFVEGMATSSEVMRSLVELAEARLGRIAVLYEWNIARAELFTLCGIDIEQQTKQYGN